MDISPNWKPFVFSEKNAYIAFKFSWIIDCKSLSSNFASIWSFKSYNDLRIFLIEMSWLLNEFIKLFSSSIIFVSCVSYTLAKLSMSNEFNLDSIIPLNAWINVSIFEPSPFRDCANWFNPFENSW